MTYQDVLAAPTCERRFFLMKLVDHNQKKQEAMEERMRSAKGGGKGTRTTRVGDEQLKSKLKSGEIPN